jgi:hypothetical protein
VDVLTLGPLVDLDTGTLCKGAEGLGEGHAVACITKLKMSPPSPQPKQCQLSRPG